MASCGSKPGGQADQLRATGILSADSAIETVSGKPLMYTFNENKHTEAGDQGTYMAWTTPLEAQVASADNDHVIVSYMPKRDRQLRSVKFVWADARPAKLDESKDLINFVKVYDAAYAKMLEENLKKILTDKNYYDEIRNGHMTPDGKYKVVLTYNHGDEAKGDDPGHQQLSVEFWNAAYAMSL